MLIAEHSYASWAVVRRPCKAEIIRVGLRVGMLTRQKFFSELSRLGAGYDSAPGTIASSPETAVRRRSYVVVSIIA